MEVLGSTTIYINGFKKGKESWVNISTKVATKNSEGEYDIAFLETRLSKDLRETLGVETIEGDERLRFNVKLESAWLGTYTNKNGESKVYLFINDLSIIDNEDKKPKTNKKYYKK